MALRPITFGVVGIFAVSYLTSALTQPLVRRAAIRLGFLDYPNENRRMHARAVPRLGGVGVFLALIVAAVVGATFDSAGHVVTLLPLVLAMAAGSVLLFLTGLADDIVGVAPLSKLVVQSAAALIVYRFGFRIEHVILPPGQIIELGLWSLPVTLLWIVGLSNAFNLIDGADGLAGGVAIIALVATAISASYLGDHTILWCSVALIGAMFGFLRYNWPPARIFLGDSGSLVVGFLLAILTVKGMSREDGAVYGLAPIFALSYPLLDTGISMLRRWLRGHPLARADGRHIHHQLQALGLGPRQTLFVLYGLSALVACLGLSATFAPPQMTIGVALVGLAVLVLLVVFGARWLQYHELLEAGASLTSALFSARSRLQDNICAREMARAIDTAHTTQEVAAIIEDGARDFRFAHMELRWGMSRSTPPAHKIASAEVSRLWALDYPIMSDLGRTDVLFMSVWCSVDSVRAAGVERIAEILAPAIERWLVRCRDQLRADSFDSGREPTLWLEGAEVAAERVSAVSNGRVRGRRISSPEARPDVRSEV